MGTEISTSTKIETGMGNGEQQIVIERRPLWHAAAIIGMTVSSLLGASIVAINHAGNVTHDNIEYGARIGDCLLGNSRVVSAEASQRFIAEANQKASALLDDKVAKPLEGATGPLSDISKAVSTTTTTEATTTTTTTKPPEATQTGELAAGIPHVEESTTTISIPEHLPECAAIPAP